MPEKGNSSHESPTGDDATGAEEVEAAPDGIEPLFFSSKTQEIFECVIDSDVTAENPHKLIPKEKIVTDFKNRAAISDFHPVKQRMLNYAGDEILIVFDADYKYGQNFYVCLTEEAKESVLNPPPTSGAAEETAEEEDGGPQEEDDLDFLARRRPWESHGSEKEIEEATVITTRPLLHYVVSRQRKHFGGPVDFADRNATDTKDAYVEYGSYDEANFNLKKLELDKGIQAVPHVVNESSQTNWIRPRNIAVQYCPREYDDEKKAGEVEKMKSVYNDNSDTFELALQQNEIMAVFRDDLLELADEETNFGTKSDGSLKEYQSFTDLQFSKEKAITQIDWHPSIKGVVAVSCVERLKLDERIERSSSLLLSPSLILIWSFSDPIHPQLILEAPDDIFTFKFNPSNPNIVAGGCINGQVVLWDVTSYQDKLHAHRSTSHKDQNKTSTLLDDEKPEHAPMVRYCAVSSIEASHVTCLSHLEWIPEHMEMDKTGVVMENRSNASTQLITCSTDGVVLFWDTRPSFKKKEQEIPHIHHSLVSTSVSQTFKYLDLSWKPFMKIPLPSPHHRGSLDFPAVSFSISESHQKPLYMLRGIRMGPGISSASQASMRSMRKPAAEKMAGSAIAQALAPPPGGELKPIENINTHFYVGTEDGNVVYVDWKMTKDVETGRLMPSAPKLSFSQHAGPVLCVQRSPFFADILLTVGGWDFCIWKEGVQSGPLLNSSSSSVRLTGGHWSPTRAGLFYITRCDGNIEVWDLLDKSHEPTKTQNVSAASITSIYPFQITHKQQLLAVGDQLGTLHIVEVPWSFRQPVPHEVGSMESFFEREVNRVTFFDDRAKNRALAKGDEGNREQTHDVSGGSLLFEDPDKAKQEYKAYLELETKLLVQLGLREDHE